MAEKKNTTAAAPQTDATPQTATASPTTATTTTPSGVQKPEGTVKAAFHYPTVKSYTGRIQYRKDGAESQMISSGRVLRAEVIEMRSRDAANGLVDNGHFSHVAADTPLGQPEEYKPKKKPEPPAEGGSQPATAPNTSGTGTSDATGSTTTNEPTQ